MLVNITLLYDGPHQLEDHYDGIKLVQPALDNEYVLIVDVGIGIKLTRNFIAIDHLGLNIVSKLEIRSTAITLVHF